MKFIYCTDWHLRGDNPRNRTDSYRAAAKAKLREIFQLARQHQVTAIISGGDTFHRPDVSNAVLLEVVDILAESPVPIYTTAGNHDIYGGTLDTYWRTSIGLLVRLLPQLRVGLYPYLCAGFNDDTGHVQLTFTAFTNRMDVDGYGYSPERAETEDPAAFKIHVAHGMLLDHVPPFARCTLLDDVVTTAPLVLTGHDHTGYGVYRRPDGVTFCNPGALMRLSASSAEMKRTVQVALIDVTNGQCHVDLIPLQSAAPGPDVLDRNSLEAEQTRQYAFQEFAALIQNEAGEKVLLDVNQIIQEIATAKDIHPDVVAKALDVINRVKEGA